MCMTLWEGLGLSFGLTCQRACLLLEICWNFWYVHFSCATVECQIVDPGLDSFPGWYCNLFTVLIYYFEVGDLVMGVVFACTVDIYCTGFMTATFFHSIFQTSAGLSNVKLTATSFRAGLFAVYILFEV